MKRVYGLTNKKLFSMRNYPHEITVYLLDRKSVLKFRPLKNLTFSLKGSNGIKY